MADFDLVFEGGGAKGLVFVGALQVFEEAGHTPRRLIGTSAGAITAALIAAGYDQSSLLATANERTAEGKPVFSTFMDVATHFGDADRDASLTYKLLGAVDIPFVPEWAEKRADRMIFSELMKLERYRVLFSFIERGGVYAGDAFLAWIQAKIEAKNPGMGGATFAEFFAHTGRHVSVVVTDTWDQEMRVLNHVTAPDCPVMWGVRMSMSIPFLWQEVRWQADWGRYRGTDITGNTFVDGGALSNFPLDLLTSNHEEVDEIMGFDVDHDAVPNMGFLIDESLAVPGAPPPPAEDEDDQAEGPTALIGRLKTVQRVKRLADTMSGARDTAVMAEFADQICRLPAKGYGTTEFDMSDDRMAKLIEAGAAATRAYLEGRFG